MKTCKYGIYKGNEYKLSYDMKKNLLLLTSDTNLIDDSFIDRYGTGVYSKIITPNELDEAYTIDVYGKINGCEVSIREEYENRLLIGTSDLQIAKLLNLNRIDKYGYEGVIDKNRVVIERIKSKISL